MTVTTIKQFDREAMLLRSLAAVLQKTVRILMGDRAVTVQIATDKESIASFKQRVPGWSLYPGIFINRDQFENFGSTKTLVQIIGLVYHEASHLIFTPRRSAFTPRSWAHEAFMILEDQRIESYFTARYAPSGKYFTEMCVRFFVEEEEMWDVAFAFTNGRSYLPLEIRQEFESRFKRPDLIDEIKELTIRYKAFRAWHFKSKQKVVHSVLERFQELMNELKDPSEQSKPLNPSQECGGAAQEEGEADEKIEQEAQSKDRKRREKEEATGEDQSGFWEDDEDDDDEDEDENSSASAGDEDEDDQESDDEGDSGASGDGEDSEGAESGEGSDDSDSPEGDDGSADGVGNPSDENDGDDDGDSSGDGESDGDGDESPDGELDEDSIPEAGNSDSIFESDGDFEDYLSEIVEAVNEDETVKNEVQQVQAALTEGNLDIEQVEFGDVKYIKLPPQALAVSALRKIALELRRLYAEVEPGWNYRSDTGRLNVDAAMHDPENYDEMFDEWDEGREHEVGLEVVILCDLSGSMDMTGVGRRMGRDLMTPASEALWIIKCSLDEVDAKTTVLGFHSETKGLYPRNKKADKTWWPRWTELGGDTQPAHAMKVARQILSASKMPNKAFIIITDGGMRGRDNVANTYEDLGELTRSIPGQKMYVGLNGAKNEQVADECDVASSVYDPSRLVVLTKNLVMKMLVERRRRR